MQDKGNILILSAGTRDKVVQYFKKEMEGIGKVIATDCSNLAPAVYDADGFYLVPRITEPGYVERILEICKKEQITGVFSLIDPELSLLAKERERFLEIGTTPIVSDYELVETCFDKYKMFRLLEKMGIPTGKCYRDIESFQQARRQGEINYPVFVKPVCGSASIYIDMLSGKCTDLFVKKKIKMRAGETDKSVSFKDERLFELLKNFAEQCGFRGMIDIDIFEIDGTYYLSEVNPRFGGGYPHAYACGVNMPKAVSNNLMGRENPATIGAYAENICMMKYNEIAIRDMSGTQIVP